MDMETAHPQKMNFESWAEKAAEQWKIFLGLVLVVLAVVAGMGLSSSMRAKKELAASNALYEAQTAAHKATATKNYDQAEQSLTAVMESQKGTRAAFEAALLAGDVWMDAGQFDKAVPLYQRAGTEGGDAFSKLLATYSVGVAQESAGKFDDAIKSYDAALSDSGSDFLRPELLMAQARSYEALHQDKKAIEIYKTVQEKFSSRSYYSGAAAAFEKQLSAGTKL